ncbi:MAG: LON peptidase substrate-binding domain-containing protein, partial [Marinirhabdus sp.]
MSHSKITDIDSLSFQELDQEADLIPLLTPEDEHAMHKEQLPETLPILPLRNTVLFPGVVVPITAGRDKSIKLINEANKNRKAIGVVSQKSEEEEEPTLKDINTIGTVARILRVLKMPDGNTTVILQGKKRFEATAVITTEPYMTATIREVDEARPAKANEEFAAIIESIREKALEIIKTSPNIPSEAAFAIKNIESNSFLVNFVCSNLNISVKEKQTVLEVNNLKERALEALKYMNVELQKLSLKNDIQSKVQSDINQQQREYFPEAAGQFSWLLSGLTLATKMIQAKVRISRLVQNGIVT